MIVSDEPNKKQIKREEESPRSGSLLSPTGTAIKSNHTTSQTDRSQGHNQGHLTSQHDPSKHVGSDSDDLPSCQVVNKSRGSLSQPLGGGSKSGVRSPVSSSRNSLQVSPQCQYGGQNTSPYLSSGSSPSCEQVYYPHHTAASNMAMQMANSAGLLQSVSTASGLLQPGAGLTAGLNLSHMSQQMSACQLAGQNSACALNSSGSNGGYGLSGAAAQAHTSLPSCTYMQSNQGYPAHIAANMGVMNLASSSHFSNPMI